MSVRSGQSVTVEFTTASPSTGAALNADSTPTGTLIVSGVDNAASVTVTNIDTGRYKAAVTLPTLAIGDSVELLISATVGTIAGKAIAWRDTKDILLDSSGDVTFNNTTLATVTTVAGSLTTYDNGDGNLKANVKATDYLTNTAGKLWVLDDTGNPIANSSLSQDDVREAVGLATANLDTQLAGIPAAVRDVSNGSPAAGSFGEAARNADAKAADIQITLGTPALSTLSDDIAALPTATENADQLLARTIAGGADGGRTVTQALAAARNKVAFGVPSAGQFTVYAADDTTPLWTGTYSRGATTLGPLTSVDPA